MPETKPARMAGTPAQRCYAVGRHGTRVDFECSEGHSFSIDYGSKRRPVSKRIGETGVRLLSRYWTREHGGTYGACPSCIGVFNVK